MTTTRPVSAPALQRPDGSPVRVLVVDDEPNLTELLSMALRYEGWEVRTAATGLAAVRAAKEFGPDAVVLDMMLPDFDGLEVLRRAPTAEAAQSARDMMERQCEQMVHLLDDLLDVSRISRGTIELRLDVRCELVDHGPLWPART